MLRRPQPATLLAFGAAVAGLISIVSALTPEFADRWDIVTGVLPPGVPEAARVVALALGGALVWLSRSLARRKRRAWQLAVAAVIASAVAHLAKGLDVEEASIHLLLLAALWRYRRAFVAPGDPATLRPLARVMLALGALAALAAVHVVFGMGAPERIEEAAALLAFALAFRAMYLWLRPLAERVRQSPPERSRAERLVREHGTDSLAFFALRRDKSYFFSGTGRSFLAYRVVNGCALVTGDPIGDASEFPELLLSFRRVARGHAWRVALLGVGEELLDLYRRGGFRAIYLGDEAVVRPDEFSLEGRPIRKVRQSVHRLEKAGYRVRVLRAGEAEPELRAEVERVSAEWRGRRPERGFTMAMDSICGYAEGVLAIAEGPDSRVGGFLQLVPSPASGGWSLAAMRRRGGTPNGLMEFLIVHALEWARAEGASEVSLNFAVFGELLRDRDEATLARRSLRFLLLRLDRFFQIDRLLSFNRKFFPTWRRRYICLERALDLPVVGLAYLHAESLLTPPGPWARVPAA
ncbi:MAG TPA: phosphatidylglycerol lysyltransferase domain-containing protein [Gaiellaceae bacterium]